MSLRPAACAAGTAHWSDMPSFLKVALLVLRKDFAIEVRSYEILSTTVFFAVSCVLIFSFAFVKDGEAINAAMVPSGVLWIAVAFSGLLALGRVFERERYGETLRALLLAPAARPAIYIGKLLGVLLVLFATELLLVPMIALIFHAPLLKWALPLAGLLVTGTIGFAAVGTLFAAMLVRSRAREVMLPILLYPVTIPVLIGGVWGTAALLGEEPSVPVAMMWMGLLGSFDVVFVTLALWTFEPLMTE
jgi:heme exporter protein B